MPPSVLLVAGTSILLGNNHIAIMMDTDSYFLSFQNEHHESQVRRQGDPERDEVDLIQNCEVKQRRRVGEVQRRQGVLSQPDGRLRPHQDEGNS